MDPLVLEFYENKEVEEKRSRTPPVVEVVVAVVVESYDVAACCGGTLTHKVVSMTWVDGPNVHPKWGRSRQEHMN
ncbi:hypothetical protein Lal_00001963 [Lupinus albus]|nr:hypothetical protein Lal_00001963 [Lupinus albus]